MSTEGAEVNTEEQGGEGQGADGNGGNGQGQGQGGQGQGQEGGQGGDDDYDPESDPGVIQAQQQLEYLKTQGFEDSDEYKQLKANLDEHLSKSGKGGQGGSGNQGGSPSGSQGGKGEGQDGDKGGEQGGIKSALFGSIETNQNPNGGGGGAEVEFKTIEDIQSFMKTSLGIEGNPKEIIEKAATWKQEASEKAVIESKFNELTEGFKNMPEPLLKGIRAWGNSQDWKSAVVSASTAPDYAKSFEQLPEADVLKHYFPGQEFTEEQISNKDAAYTNTLAAAKRIFESEQVEFNKTRQALIDDLNKQKEDFKGSVSKTFTKFTTDYPKADNSAVQEIKTLMEKDQVMSLFKDENGAYKDNAAELLFFAKMGKQEITSLVNALKERNSTLQQAVDRGKEKPGSQGGKGAGDDPNSEKKIMASMADYFQTDPYASK